MAYAKLASKYMQRLSPLTTSARPGGRLSQPVQCVLFDIYGTLFISGSGDISVARKTSPQAHKLQGLLQKFNIRKTSDDLAKELYRTIENEHRRLRGDGVDYPEIRIEKIWKQILKTDDLDSIRRFAIEYEMIANPVFPMPNLDQTLTACRQKKLTMGLISNAQFFTPLLFEWFLNAAPEGLGFHSELIFLSYQLGHAKPSPLPFEKASAVIQAMGLTAAACLYVGNDMLNDIYPAKQVGFQTALFAGDARSLRMRTEDRRCCNLSADLVLTDLSQLIDHIT
jgi:putative hydrolase of the HAD superfamily